MRTASLAAMAALSLIATTAHAQSVEVEIDRFELQEGEGDDPFLFDSTASVGGDAVALVLKAEGVNEAAHLDVNEVESKAMLAFSPVDGMTLMAGVRHDFRPGGDLTYATIAIEQALGPIFEAEHYFFVSEHGDVTGAGQVLAGLPLGPTLTLEPRLAFGWAANEVAEEGNGSGIGNVELSARLRQAIGPIINVYVGAVHEVLVGNTRDMARAEGERTSTTRAR